MSIVLLTLTAAVIAATVTTIVQAGPGRALSVTTLTRLLPLGMANDLLMAHAQIGPHLLPAIDSGVTALLTSGLIALHLLVRRTTRH